MSSKIQDDMDRRRDRQRELRQQQQDQDWQQRADSGQTLIQILHGEHWESTRPSERNSDQNREAILHSIRINYGQ